VWRIGVAGLVVGALVIGACSSSGQEVGILGAELDCANSIDTVAELPTDYVELAGVVALPDLETHQLGRRGPDGDPDSSRRFAKMGLLICPDTTFELHVGPGSQGNALIGWGNVGDPGPVGSLSVDGCTWDAAWSVFAGGVWVLEPDCVNLLVVTASGQTELDLPIGASCPQPAP